MRSRALALVLLGGVACGSGQSPPAPPVRPALLNEQAASGSALTARWYVVDGWRYFARFEGPGGEACRHAPDVNGSIRCLPLRDAAYADSACTERVALVDPCAAVPTRVALAEPDVCSPGYRVYAVGDPAPGPLYQGGGAGCMALGTPLAARRLGAEIDPSSFVAAATVDDPSVGGVSTTWFVGSDGSRRYAGVRDAATGLACSPDSASDGVARCVPDGETAFDESGRLFGDPTCSTRAAYLSPGCSLAAYAQLLDSSGVHVFPIGAAAIPYSSASGTCSQATPPAGFETRLLGPEIPATSFAETPYTALGEPSWQIGTWQLPGGRIWSPSDQGGIFAIASDGVRRRFAAYAYGSRTYFADSTCRIPLARVPQGGGVTYAVLRDASTCPWRYRAYQLVGRWDGPIFTGPSCTLTILQPGYEMDSIGPEIPPGSFALVSIE